MTDGRCPGGRARAPFRGIAGATMATIPFLLTGAAVAVALGSLAVLVARRPRSEAELLFAVVSGSMALALLAPWLDPAPGWLAWALAIGGSATCNGYWLVSRALFRGDGAVRPVHVAVAAGVAVLIAAWRGSGLSGAASPAPALLALGSLLTLSSSVLLGLTFLEALRGWSGRWPAAERRLRLGFLVVFAAAVLSTTVLQALAEAWPAAAGWRSGAVALSASAMLLLTHALLRHRRGQPVPSSRPAAIPPAPGSEEARLAEALRHALEVREVYREPELKVADLARRLGTSEHRLSRLITQGLGERNFNQLVNRHRIAHACRRLADPHDAAGILDISLDCGFASLGPFNRAFKATTGMTPSAYRAAHRGAAVPQVAQGAPAC